MRGDDSRDVVRRFWETVYGARDTRALQEIVTDDFELYDPTLNRRFSAEEIARVFEAIHTDIPKFSARIEEVFRAEGDRVVTRFTFRGPAGGDAESSGDPSLSVEMVEMSAIAIARMAEGRVNRMWLHWESLRAERELKPDVVSWKWPPWK